MTAFLVAGVAALAASGVAQPAPTPDCALVRSHYFELHNDPWINLHHFLFQWARTLHEPPPGDFRRSVDVAERGDLDSLAEGERRTWEAALDYYRRELVSRDLLFDRDLIALRGRLGEIACSRGDVNKAGADLHEALMRAMPVYRRRWWPKHRVQNSEWIESLLGLLDRFEEPFSERLAAAYGGEWPSVRTRVDVAVYANWAGGYTTNGPDHVTVASGGYSGFESVEILFHEVSHAAFFEQRLLGQVAAAFRRLGAEPPDRLSHAIQFATPARISVSLMNEGEMGAYESVADRVYLRGRFREQYLVVVKHWGRFVDGEIKRAEALDRIAAEVSKDGGAR